MIKVIIHQSLRIPDQGHVFEGNFEGVTILQAIASLIEHSPELTRVCLQNGSKRPGVLYIWGKTELASLGLLDANVDEWDALEIRVIPILHGG